MKTIFFGCNHTSWLILRELLEMGEDVAGIFTMPETFNISYSKNPVSAVTYKSLSEFESEYGVPVLTIEKKMNHYTPRLRDMNPDLCIVGGFYLMIPKEMLSIPPKGFIGFHPSLLPKYRGGAPVNWAIINGEKKTGTSMFYFDDGMDSGDIIAQREVTIETKDTIREVYNKINTVTVEMIRKYVPLIKEGKAPRIPQDHSLATYVPQRSPEDGEIDWNLPAERLYNWIRAQTMPYPGAFSYHNGKLIKIWAAAVRDIEVRSGAQTNPGTVIDISKEHGGILVSTAEKDRALLLTRVGTEEEESIEAKDYIRTSDITAGAVLGRQ